VLIIRGGEGENYASSLKRGGELIAHINEHLSDKYTVSDILIDKEGNWHIHGMPVMPSDVAHRVDVVWNTAHPGVSAALSGLTLPHVGTHPFASALQTSREMLKDHIKNMDIELPRSIILPLYQEDFDGPRERYSIKKAKEVFEKFSSPWLVKTLTPDAGMGMHLAKTFPELVNAIEDGVKHQKSILVEEFIVGKVASVHSVPGFRGDEKYVFPPVNTFGNFSPDEKARLGFLAKELHGHAGAGHYLKADFVVNSRGNIYLFNIDTHPDVRQGSHFSQACESVGAPVHHVVEHILERNLRK
jgi:D-alanine-D-alanine ligase-like ATP-grasp enzyme